MTTMTSGAICVARCDHIGLQTSYCPTCACERGFLVEHFEWYGWAVTCLACGDSWQDGELCERPFERGWRQKSIDGALRTIDAGSAWEELMLHHDALRLAEDLAAALRPVCHRVEIAGSLRRGKPEVKDIEVVAIPLVSERSVLDMFGTEVGRARVDLIDGTVYRLAEWAPDEQTPRWGQKYKRLRHESGISCDLFLTDARRWGYTFTIRTGPGEFSKALVTLALRRAWHFSDCLLHRHRKYGGPCLKGDGCPLILETPEEIDVFKVLGLPWIEPMERTAELMWRMAKLEAMR